MYKEKLLNFNEKFIEINYSKNPDEQQLKVLLSQEKDVDAKLRLNSDDLDALKEQREIHNTPVNCKVTIAGIYIHNKNTVDATAISTCTSLRGSILAELLNTIEEIKTNPDNKIVLFKNIEFD